jgi:predicted flap endonuclease-1-like 5' DNA nuclease
MYKTARNLTVLGAGLSASMVVGWLLLRQSKRAKEAARGVVVKSQIRSSQPDEIPQIVLPLDVLEPEPQAGDDDMTQIKDIGPRFATALGAIGITRWSQLAEQTPETLAEKLAPHVTVTAQRIRTRNWIGQAAQLAKS